MSLVFLSITLNVLTRSHLSSYLLAVLAKLKPTPNKTNLAAHSKYMTQEAIKNKKQAKQNCDDSLASNKWLWSSLLRRQSEHLLGPCIPNRWSLSWVVSFCWTATHWRNDCLGKTFLNHTMSCHSTIWLWIHSCSQATLTENLWFGESNQILGLDLEGIASTMGCQPIAWVVGILHSKLLISTFTLAFFFIPESYMNLSP